MSLVSGESQVFLSHDASHQHAAVWQTSFQLVFNFSENSAIINSQVQLVFNFNENWSSDSHEWSTLLRKALTLSSFHDVEIVTIYAADKHKTGLSWDSDTGNAGGKNWNVIQRGLFQQFNKGRVYYIQGSQVVEIGEIIIRCFADNVVVSYTYIFCDQSIQTNQPPLFLTSRTEFSEEVDGEKRQTIDRHLMKQRNQTWNIGRTKCMRWYVTVT